MYFSIVRLVQMVARAGCHTWCRLGCLPEHTQPPFLIRTLANFSLVTSRKSNAFQKKMVKCSGFTQMVIQKILMITTKKDIVCFGPFQTDQNQYCKFEIMTKMKGKVFTENNVKEAID